METNGKVEDTTSLYKKGNGKVFVAYVHNGMVHETFMRSVLNMLSYDAAHRDVIGTVYGVQGLYVADNRNTACWRFIESKDEWLFFIDTDITFDPDLLYKLLDSADPEERAVMSGLYFGYMGTKGLIVPIWLGRSEDNDEFMLLSKLESGIQEVAGVGMGCCLIHRSVIEKIHKKYNGDGWVWFAHDLFTVDGEPMRIGEDLGFANRCRAVGVKIWGDGLIVVSHTKQRYENLETFMKSFDSAQMAEEIATTKIKHMPR